MAGTCKGTGVAKTNLLPGSTRAGWDQGRQIWDRTGRRRPLRAALQPPFQTSRKVFLLSNNRGSANWSEWWAEACSLGGI